MGEAELARCMLWMALRVGDPTEGLIEGGMGRMGAGPGVGLRARRTDAPPAEEEGTGEARFSNRRVEFKRAEAPVPAVEANLLGLRLRARAAVAAKLE